VTRGGHREICHYLDGALRRLGCRNRGCRTSGAGIAQQVVTAQRRDQFVTRADGNGGFAVVETDNLAGLALDNAKFSPYLDFSVYPVLDVQEGAALMAEAAEFRKSIT
jgi:hypothetical protein